MSSSFLQDVPAATLTQDTIRRLYELIDKAKVDPKFQELVYKITGDLASKDYKGEITRILKWAKNNIRYTRDPYGVELVQDVWSTLSRERADCDDFDVLVGAMVEVMGAPVELITVSTRPDKEPVHTYPAAYVNGKWYALDATVPQSYPGWEPGNITDKIVWTRQDVGMSGYDLDNIGGLGMFKPTVFPANLTPGIPNDISHTYAHPMPGTPVVSRRPQPGIPYARVARYSDLSESPEPGNIPYGPTMRIKPFPMPRDIWSHVPRNSVPIKINAWPHDAKPWKKDMNAMLPETHVPEDMDMSNLGSYAARMGGLSLGDVSPASVDALVSAVASDTKAAVQSGAVAPSDAPAHAQNLVDAVTTGDASTVSQNPATAAAVMNIVKTTPNKKACGIFNDPSLSWMPRPDGRMPANGLGEFARTMRLGDLDQEDQVYLCDAISQDVAQQVAQGSVPPAAVPAVSAAVVNAIQTGNSNVLQSTPATVTAVTNIMKKRGRGGSSTGTSSTPATSTSHPTTKHMGRKHGMRDGSAAYWEQDESTSFLPMMYGLGATGNGRGSLYAQVHKLVKARLPHAIRAAGVHPAHVRQLLSKGKASLRGLGQTTTPAATATVDPTTISNASSVITAAIPPASATDPNSVSGAVTAGINAIVGAVAPAASTGWSLNLSGWGVPILVGAAILGMAMLMKKPKKGVSYQSNPSRRRSSGKKRGSSGGVAKYVPWVAAGAAAYLIFKPGATTAAGTAAPSLLQSALNLFKPTTANGVTTASPLTSAIASIFGSGSKAAASTSPTSTPATAANPYGIVTADQLAPSGGSSSPSPSMVTSIPAAAPADTSSSDAGLVTSLDS